MFNQPPVNKSLENKDYTSKIELHFFRHGEKESNKEKTDKEIRLTEKGRGQAVEKGKQTDLSQALAFGSPRRRTQETAGLVMTGKTLELTGEESLEDLKTKLEKGLEYGSRLAVEEKLDFPEDPTTEYYKLTQEHYKAGNLLKFLVEESDELAKKYKDENTFTYLRMAKQIAELIKKYLKISPNWDKLTQDKQKNYRDTMERFMGTHQTIPESFLAKVIEKTQGREERDNFVKLLDNKGFDYVEGFDTEILNTPKGPKIKIHYENRKNKDKPFVFDEYIKPKLLDEIIEDGK